MRSPQHAILPERLAALSISAREVVLPESAALEAIDVAEAAGVLILGWEGWVKTADGRVGHGSAPQGTVSLEHMSVREAAALCRSTIPEAAERWRSENTESTDQLHFCLTFKVRGTELT